MIRFKVAAGAGPRNLELTLNRWAEELPREAKIRRTQLAATLSPTDEPDWLYALISYELPDATSENG